MVEECFTGARIVEGSAVKFGKSTADASEFLVKRFGENAEGVCSVQFKRGGGHAFNWKVVDGSATFFDGQQGSGDVSRLWKFIALNGKLTVARLDNATPNYEAVKKYVESR